MRHVEQALEARIQDLETMVENVVIKEGVCNEVKIGLL